MHATDRIYVMYVIECCWLAQSVRVRVRVRWSAVLPVISVVQYLVFTVRRASVYCVCVLQLNVYIDCVVYRRRRQYQHDRCGAATADALTACSHEILLYAHVILTTTKILANIY